MARHDADDGERDRRHDDERDPVRAEVRLWILRQHSPSMAALVARYLVLDERPTQAAYIITDHLAHSDPLIERFERWARERLAQGFSLAR